MTSLAALCLASIASLGPLGATAREDAATPTPAELRSVIAKRLPRIAYRGGPFLRQPRVVTITFADDDPELVARLERFGDTITRSAWWRTVTDGYCARPGDCIREGRPGLAVRLDDALPADLHAAELAELLVRHARSGRLGALDADSLVLAYLPARVHLRDAFVPRYCEGRRRAVHRALRFDGKAIGYAVIPRCSTEAELTATASHEVLEVATNPDPARRGFAFEQSSATLGFTASGVEPVDPCGIVTRDTHRALESGFVVQRAWSNAQAADGREPCVPASPDRPYLALVPERPTVRLARVGECITIPLQAAADRPAPAWTVSAVDLTGLHEKTQYLDVALDRSTVSAGEVATLTISVRKLHPKELALVGLVSTLGDASHLWPVAVVMR